MKIPKPRSLPKGPFELPKWAESPRGDFKQALLEVYREEGIILDRIYIGGMSSLILFGAESVWNVKPGQDSIPLC